MLPRLNWNYEMIAKYCIVFFMSLQFWKCCHWIDTNPIPKQTYSIESFANWMCLQLKLQQFTPDVRTWGGSSTSSVCSHRTCVFSWKRNISLMILIVIANCISHLHLGCTVWSMSDRLLLLGQSHAPDRHEVCLCASVEQVTHTSELSD